MRVLHIINSLEAGGAELQLLQEISYLAKRGVQQWLVTLETSGIWSAKVGALLGPERTVSLDLGPRLGRLPLGYLPLARLVRAWKPQLISTQLPQSDILGRLVAGNFGIPAVCTWQYPAYDLDPWNPTKLRRALILLRWLDRFTKDRGTHYIAVSEAVAESYCAALGLPRSKCTVIHNSVDLARFSRPAAPASVPRPGLKLIHVGRHVPQKGVDTLLRALGALPASVPVSVDMFGGGPLTGEFKKLAAKLALGDRARFMGKVPDLAPFLAAADGFLLPSRNEGLSLAYLEALASGLPVIASDIPPNREIDPGGLATCFVPPEDSESLARAIVDFAEKPEDRARLAGRARSVAEPFSVEKIGAKIYELFRATAGKDSGERPCAE